MCLYRQCHSWREDTFRVVDQVSHRIVLTAALFRDMVPWQECSQKDLGNVGRQRLRHYDKASKGC